MTTPEPPPNSEYLQKAFHSILLRMRSYALQHIEKVGPRTIFSLQQLDLLDAEVSPVGTNIDAVVLRDPAHPRRETLPPGLILVYRTEGDKPQRMLIELPVLLYSSLPDIRKSSLAELDRLLSAGGGLAITPKTRKVYADNHDGLTSDDPGQWRPAAIAVNDALYDDILVAMQCLRQCLTSEPAIQGSIETFAPKVFHPAISSLDSILLAPANPEGEHPALVEIIASVVDQADTLGDACKVYYSRLGHLPLAPDYSLGAVVFRWLEKHKDTDAWTAVWGWARATPGPIPRYHACTVFVLHPELVPAGKLPKLWQSILDVVHVPEKDNPEHLNQAPWLLRRDLARLFSHHLEANMPEGPGANFANFAWWLAERVAEIFPDDPKSAQCYHEKWVVREADITTSTWLSAGSLVGHSCLKYMTNNIPSPWATGLLAIMGANLDRLAPGEQADDLKAKFHEALISHLVSALPFAVEAPADPTFSLECPLGETALAWAKHRPEDQAAMFRQLVEGNKKLSTTDGLCTALKEMDKSPLGDQAMMAIILKAKAYTEPDLADRIMEILSDEAWRQRILGGLEEPVLGHLVEAFTILQPVGKEPGKEKWFTSLPHFFADLCEQTGDAERRKFLFRLVAHFSIGSDTVSAVQRLLRGSQKGKYLDLAKECRASIEDMWGHYPPWVQGRMRAMLASLHVG